MTAKILIVDDEPNMVQMLEIALQRAGHTPLVAKNGMECLTKVISDDPDLIILDIMMPDMDGLEVCRRIRDMPDKATLPIIMLSARVQSSDKVAGLQAGADDYVTKPVDMSEMVARVEALLARTERAREVPSQPVVQLGRVLGFIGAKGGVGTTTVALNVAASLAMRQRQVVAAELRAHYGTFSSQLSKTPDRGLWNLLGLAPERIDPQQLNLHLSDTPFGVRVLFGPQQVTEYKAVDPRQAEAILNGLSNLADFVVVDLPSAPSGASWAALRRCDFVVVVVEPEPTCLAAGRATLDLVRSWGVGSGRVGTVVVNRAGSAGALGLSDVKTEMGCEIMGLVPPMAEACLAAQRRATPVVLAQPNIVAANNLNEIAGRLGAEGIMPMNI